ncbi:hypothetical protein L210DRAFT_3516236, partial [Boletus edulis BED1]
LWSPDSEAYARLTRPRNIHNPIFKVRFHFSVRTWPTARPFYPPVSRFLSIAFTLVASDVVQ